MRFIIYALGRSRTAWMSRFLTYGKWTCLHEAALALRDPRQITSFFAQPYVGTAETGAALAFPLIQHYAAPRSVVVKREVESAIRAMEEAYEASGLAYDALALRKIFYRTERALDDISRHYGVLTLAFEDLGSEETCRRLFEFCLQLDFDRAHWLALREKHIELDLREVVSYYQTHLEEIEALKHACKRELFRLARTGELRAIH